MEFHHPIVFRRVLGCACAIALGACSSDAFHAAPDAGSSNAEASASVASGATDTSPDGASAELDDGPLTGEIPGAETATDDSTATPIETGEPSDGGVTEPSDAVDSEDTEPTNLDPGSGAEPESDGEPSDADAAETDYGVSTDDAGTPNSSGSESGESDVEQGAVDASVPPGPTTDPDQNTTQTDTDLGVTEPESDTGNGTVDAGACGNKGQPCCGAGGDFGGNFGGFGGGDDAEEAASCAPGLSCAWRSPSRTCE